MVNCMLSAIFSFAAPTSAFKSKHRQADSVTDHHVTILVCCNTSASLPGYGFTVRDDTDGSGPARVVAVHSHGPAAEAGLLPGDHLVSINGLNVTGRSASSVTSLIHRNEASASGSLRLDVLRSSFRPTRLALNNDESLLHSDTGYCTVHSRDLTDSGKRSAFDDDQSHCERAAEPHDNDDFSTLNDARLDSHVYDSLDDVTVTSSVTKNDDRTWSLDVSLQRPNDVNNNDGECSGKVVGRRRASKIDDVTTLLCASPVSIGHSQRKAISNLLTIRYK